MFSALVRGTQQSCPTPAGEHQSEQFFLASRSIYIESSIIQCHIENIIELWPSRFPETYLMNNL